MGFSSMHVTGYKALDARAPRAITPHRFQRNLHRHWRRSGFVFLLGALIALAGCTRVNSILGRDDNSQTPSPLPTITNPINVQTLWSKSATRGARSHYLKLVPAVSETHIFAAGFRGELTALDLLTGDERWAVDTGLAISGGLGQGDGIVLLGTEEGEVAAYDAQNGDHLWTAKVSSEVLAAPQIAQDMVVVRTIDGKVFGLRASDGSAAWAYDRNVPTLSLRGTSPPVVHGGLAISGFDGGRLVALNISDGSTDWETRITVPSGRTDLQRIVDVDAEPVVRDGVVYAVTFQGRVVAVDITTGKTVWRRNMSSHSGLAAGEAQLFVADAEDTVWSLSRDTSSSLWRQEKLKARKLGPPAIFKDYVLLGDFEGYVHWLSASTGEILGRVQVDDDQILVKPIVVGDIVYVLGNGGTLAAYTLP
ncbi:MAG: outer membrane protein assembly factor BamB [Gammaproteobacteria bacterium]|jgi:outer membrane protein assembly factor BamB